ncbi:HpcH/HpaI aldolase/citrate lyase family protein [Pseudonocardia xishanensis]|uniref:CoA ester lyase n=1 Tax=Pseudonocardia xishanensis TaxID=630995 RepID=A0ABP8RH26_9PSEU
MPLPDPPTDTASSLRDAAVPIRSLVHVGADPAAFEQALAAGADALFFDLEEPRLPYGATEKAAARTAVRDCLAALSPGSAPLSFVRVHSPWSGETLADLRAALLPSLTGVILPKTAGPQDVIALDAVLTCAEHDVGRDGHDVQILPFLETAQSIRLAYEIATASPRVTYMGGMVSRFGDVHRAIGYRWTPDGAESHHLRSKVLIDARAAGIRYPISGAWGGDPGDLDGLRSWGEQLRDLGYYGMLVGPSGVGVANEVFSPSTEDIAYWTTLVSQSDDSAEPPSDRHLSYVESARTNLRWASLVGRLRVR